MPDRWLRPAREPGLPESSFPSSRPVLECPRKPATVSSALQARMRPAWSSARSSTASARARAPRASSTAGSCANWLPRGQPRPRTQRPRRHRLPHHVPASRQRPQSPQPAARPEVRTPPPGRAPVRRRGAGVALVLAPAQGAQPRQAGLRARVPVVRQLQDAHRPVSQAHDRLTQLLLVPSRLLEVMAENLVQLAQVGASLLKPVSEALVEFGAGRFGDSVICGVTDQQVPEAKGVRPPETAPCPAGSAAFERAQRVAGHLRLARESAWTAPRWNTSPSTAAHSSMRRSDGSSWSRRAAISA